MLSCPGSLASFPYMLVCTRGDWGFENIDMTLMTQVQLPMEDRERRVVRKRSLGPWDFMRKHF